MYIDTDQEFEAFVWDDKYNTDIDMVDTQHHKLVDLINQLGAISTHQTSSGELGAILNELANYTVYHFDTEEKLMEHYAIDEAHRAIHIKAHQHFTSQVTQAANVLMEALSEMYGKLGDKTLEVMKKNQELEAEQEALRVLNEQLEQRVKQRTTAVEQANRQLLANNAELKQLNEQLESAQTQLLQSEKMASIGQLAAGVAHEINNPVGFVNSNLGTLGKYISSMFKVIDAYAAAEANLDEKTMAEVSELKRKVDLPYVLTDIPNQLKESQDGLARVKRIIQ